MHVDSATCAGTESFPCHVLLAQVDAWKGLATDELTHISYRYNSIFLNADSYMCAQLSAGSVVETTLQVCRGDLANAVAVVRPPGHHAEEGVAMGFCIYNNVAVAAAAALECEGINRVLIVDWDVCVPVPPSVLPPVLCASVTCVLAFPTVTMATAHSTCSRTTHTCCTSPCIATTMVASTQGPLTRREIALVSERVRHARPTAELKCTH